MKKQLTSVGLILLLVTEAMFAQTTAFDGAAITLGLNAVFDRSKVNTNYTYTNLFANLPDAFGVGNYDSNKSSSIAVAPSLNASFTEIISNELRLGFVGGINLIQTNLTQRSEIIIFPNPNNRVDFPKNYSISTTVTPKGHWFVGVEPGCLLSQKLLAYMKIFHHQLRANIKTKTFISPGNIRPDLVISNPRTSASFKGLGLGFGTHYRITQSYFIKTEAEWIQYSGKTIAAPGLRSVSDELTLTQTQRINPNTFSFGIQAGYQF